MSKCSTFQTKPYNLQWQQFSSVKHRSIESDKFGIYVHKEKKDPFIVCVYCRESINVSPSIYFHLEKKLFLRNITMSLPAVKRTYIYSLIIYLRCIWSYFVMMVYRRFHEKLFTFSFLFFYVVCFFTAIFLYDFY